MKPMLFFVILYGILCINKHYDKEPNLGQIKDTATTTDTVKLIDDYLTNLVTEKKFSGALLIMRGNDKIFSKGYGWADNENKIPFTPATLASIGSITKSFTAAAIMKLVEKKAISLADPLEKFFSNVPADKSDITIHHLLTHSAGFHEFLKSDGGIMKKLKKINSLKGLLRSHLFSSLARNRYIPT